MKTHALTKVGGNAFPITIRNYGWFWPRWIFFKPNPDIGSHGNIIA